MQGLKVRYIISVVLLSVAQFAQAEPLQPDPAWQQGKLENGFSWQYYKHHSAQMTVFSFG